MNARTPKQPLIGPGLESLLALAFAAGMFTLVLLKPVYVSWLPF